MNFDEYVKGNALSNLSMPGGPNIIELVRFLQTKTDVTRLALFNVDNEGAKELAALLHR